MPFRSSSRSRLSAPVAPVAFAFTVLCACSGQGEGDLCSPSAGNHGNDDCQSGLICVTAPNYTLGRCCPTDRSTATTSVCSANTGGVDASPAPPDASGDDASDAQASADAPPDAAADAGMGTEQSDAPAE